MNGSKWTVTTFHTTTHMPTYLAAFVICDYGHVSRTERTKEVSKEVCPGKGIFVLAAECSSALSASGSLATHLIVPSCYSLQLFPNPLKVLSVALRNET